MAATAKKMAAESSRLQLVEAEGTTRYGDGWRAGKPVEDPEKLKRWGWVTAKPSEYLICVRRGHVDRSHSGQGARVFKWPWHSVAIVPTTLQRIEFVADQVTREKVGVRVCGLAVFRITEPEIAFRVLNFSYAERASEKLAATMRDMFVGAARRLIANLSLDACISKRKEAIAEFLMQEIAPVVGGRGALEDSTDRGWGVVVDNIEIQDVRVLSEQVFANLQAPFRASIATQAKVAELEHQQQVAERQAQLENNEAELQRARALMELQTAEEQRRAQAEAESRALRAEAQSTETAHQTQLQELEQERIRQHYALETELKQRETQQQVEVLLRKIEAETSSFEGELQAVQQRRLAELEQLLSPGRIQHDLVQTALPEIARAFAHSMGPVNYTHIGADGDGPQALVGGAIAQILTLLRGFGLDPAQLAGGNLRREKAPDSERSTLDPANTTTTPAT